MINNTHTRQRTKQTRQPISTMTDRHQSTRQHLDKLFLLDAIVSLLFGGISLLAPHGFIQALSGGYNHNTHEVFRLHGCLRIAVGWILYNVRSVDDGNFRRTVCEALMTCYAVQALAVIRAQFTEHSSRNVINWLAIGFLCNFSAMYGTFRFGKGGGMIKIYELPSTTARSIR